MNVVHTAVSECACYELPCNTSNFAGLAIRPPLSGKHADWLTHSWSTLQQQPAHSLARSCRAAAGRTSQCSTYALYPLLSQRQEL